MYYEEKQVNGITHYRTSPDGEWYVRVSLTLAEYEAMRLDAERYRFIRESKFIHNGEPFIARSFVSGISQIDAAIKEGN
jgi:hypothetical protein